MGTLLPTPPTGPLFFPLSLCSPAPSCSPPDSCCLQSLMRCTRAPQTVYFSLLSPLSFPHRPICVLTPPGAHGGYSHCSLRAPCPPHSLEPWVTPPPQGGGNPPSPVLPGPPTTASSARTCYVPARWRDWEWDTSEGHSPAPGHRPAGGHPSSAHLRAQFWNRPSPGFKS